jgi:hypothetical protein
VVRVAVGAVDLRIESHVLGPLFGFRLRYIVRMAGNVRAALRDHDASDYKNRNHHESNLRAIFHAQLSLRRSWIAVL